MAQQVTSDEVIVTGTRRASTVQDVPLNIAAVGAAEIEEQGLNNLTQVAQWVPGVHIVDQGGRDGNAVIVRGLNADGLGSSEAIGNSAGGTVAVYLGEIPIYLDLRLNDVERVEFLLGPQGTLYGAGTLGGAIRYIPRRPSFDAPSVEVRGDGYFRSEGDDISTDFGATFNAPFSDTFAMRMSFDFLNDTGFIDYNYLVQEVGISNPDPDFNNPADVAANLTSVPDANTEEIFSGRLAARWAPTDWFDATLTYYWQHAEIGSRQISHHRNLIGSGPYESAMRVLEPNTRNNELLALEATIDLGWAELTSATGFSRYSDRGQRDQTDLLIGLQFSYEAFPSFTAFTLEESEEENFVQEFRLVSAHEGPLQYIFGAFYNTSDTYGVSSEFTPFYDEYLTGGFDARPDNLEYYAFGTGYLTESALYGELSYNFTDAWQVTLGGRWYTYDLETTSGTDLPLLFTVFGPYAPDEINFDTLGGIAIGGQADDGFLFKFNTSYRYSEDFLAYFTVSEGYRIGNSNGVGPCPDPLPPNQIVCALPNELAYTSDTTTNYELGFHTRWFDRRLTVNAALFYIEWTDPQVSGATLNGLSPITRNAEGARTMGFEVFFDADITEHFSLRGNFAYNNAELTSLTPNLLTQVNPPGFGTSYVDGQEGDRLPGAPEFQGALFASYTVPMSDELDLAFNWGVVHVGDIESRTGGRAGGLTLDAYTLNNAGISLTGDQWGVTLYANNIFDEFYETGVRSTPLSNQTVTDDNGDTVYVRSFYTAIGASRTVGLRFYHRFGG